MSEPIDPGSRRAARDSANERTTALWVKPTVLEQTVTTTDAAPERSGIGAVFAKHPQAWLAGGIAVVFLLLGTGAVMAGIAVGSRPTTPAAAAPGTATDEPVDPNREVPGTIPVATRLRTCSIATQAGAGSLGDLRGYVIDTDSGQVLYSSSGTKAASPSTVLGMATASAAISALGPEFRMSTTVYQGADPGSIVLVGGGDPTLSNTDPGQQSVYRDAPKLSDLANQVNTALAGAPVTSITLDSTYWSSDDKWDSSWSRSLQTGGTLSEVTALQVDGDRADPTKQTSPRTTDPVMRAGELFAAKLGFPDATLSLGAVPDGAAQIGEVKSQPLSALVNTMLQSNDATLAEQLARVTSLNLSMDGSAASVAKAIPQALGAIGLDTSGVVIRDGSGTSAKNSVSPKFVTRLVAKLLEGSSNLNYVYNSLPVGGKTGTLADRFTGDNKDAAASVNAATGSTSGGRSLAGTVKAEDGTVLAFAFYAIKDNISTAAKGDLDAIVAGAYACGDNLASS